MGAACYVWNRPLTSRSQTPHLNANSCVHKHHSIFFETIYGWRSFNNLKSSNNNKALLLNLSDKYCYGWSLVRSLSAGTGIDCLHGPSRIWYQCSVLRRSCVCVYVCLSVYCHSSPIPPPRVINGVDFGACIFLLSWKTHVVFILIDFFFIGHNKYSSRDKNCSLKILLLYARFEILIALLWRWKFLG